MSKSEKKSTKSSTCLSRPPIVSVLGHIDHGKTTLLSKIKKVSLTDSESGGITQHTGAYQVNYQGKKITFIDTPGHAAFAQMRARGAKVTDLALLVIAGDEGVKPQTEESIKYIKQAGIPFIVVVNKIDLPKSDVEKVKGQLAKQDVLVEKRGGDIVVVPVSAKTGEGIEDLLEMILLVAQMREIKVDKKAPFSGVVVESSLNHSRGPIATVLVKNGTLVLGAKIWAGGIKAKVKAMYDDSGKRVKKALPSDPVEVLGFEAVPQVGSVVSLEAQGKAKKPLTEQDSGSQVHKEKSEDKTKKTLNLVLKADTKGTLEAVKSNLPTQANVISWEVGDVNESDIFLAQTVGAKIIGFNVQVLQNIKKLAQTESVEIRIYSIIYELLKDLNKEIKKLEEPVVKEEILGKAEILEKFLIDGKRVAGCLVTEGKIAGQDKLRLERDERIAGKCQIESLKQGKKDVDLVKKGEEFGILFKPELDFKRGDVLVSYKLPQKG